MVRRCKGSERFEAAWLKSEAMPAEASLKAAGSLPWSWDRELKSCPIWEMVFGEIWELEDDDEFDSSGKTRLSTAEEAEESVVPWLGSRYPREAIKLCRVMLLTAMAVLLFSLPHQAISVP
jgi:hypothetical protein